MMQKTNVELAQQLIDSLTSETVATLTINGKTLQIAVNGVDLDVIDDEQMLIHINAAI